ncbi:MAG: M20/M25/M40 family metallo-hydrolase [Gammaproteobacteria bacterium]
MNRSSRISSSLLALALVTGAHAADRSSESIAGELRDRAMRGESVAWDFVSELTTRIGPRPAGSPAERAAAEWSAKKLKALGFENVRIEPFPMTAWVRGTEHAEITAPSPQPVVAGALGGSPPTPAGGVEGDLALFATLDDLKAAAPGSLNGMIAMITRQMPATQDGSGYVASSASRRDGPNEAARRGAIGFAVRSLATGGNRFAHAGAARYDGARFSIPSFALSEPDADQILRLTQLGEKVRLRLTSTASYVPNAISQNVVADIRGSERAGEVIVLGAHLDSWDLGTGAIDDAAGLAIITGAARLVGQAPRKPKRTVRVVFYGSEEVSQPGAIPLGGESYPKEHKAEIASHVLASESDFGADRVYSVSLPAGAFATPFGATLVRVLAPIAVVPSNQPPGNGGADTAPLEQLGVPIFLLNQDGTKYFDVHHTANDTLDKIDRARSRKTSRAWAALVWLAADSDIDFPRFRRRHRSR